MSSGSSVVAAKPGPDGAKRTVAFHGSRTGRSAFALVNARWSDGLERTGRYRAVDLASGREGEAVSRGAAPAPDVILHHDFETHFTAFRPPPDVPCVAVRTWDFGPLPTEWAAKINSEFHQFWAYSDWIARQATAGGVHADRVRVVPLGVDPEVYRPEGERTEPEVPSAFRFLFVGGVSPRKGSDILVEAYVRAFSREDEVVLVIKDHSGDHFYKEDRIRERVREVAADPRAPRILHIDRFLPAEELAGLYRACDVAVFPYRAEGFCLPILEAMACGTPSIVPEFGACLDFCTEKTSFMTPVRRIRVPVGKRFKVALGFEEEVEEVDFCEMGVDALARQMRSAFEGPRAILDEMAAAGVARAHGRFTWARSVGEAADCLERLWADQDRSTASR